MSGGTENVETSGGRRGYRKLLAFQAAHQLVKATYQQTAGFPKAEMFGLTSQMRRAAVSAAANIVEGYALSTTPLFLRHLSIALGSCKELEYYVELLHELGYCDGTALDGMRHLTGRAAYLINALSRGLKNKKPSVGPAVKESDATLHSPHSLHSLDAQGDQ